MKDGDLRLCDRRSLVTVIRDIQKQINSSALHIGDDNPFDELLLPGVSLSHDNLHIGHVLWMEEPLS